VFYSRPVRKLRGATIELLEDTFSMRYVLRRYKQEKSIILLVLRESPDNKDVNTEADKATALEAVTRRQPVKTHQTENI
jgi:hypothetical protein